MKIVPNIISFFRICLVPVFIIVYFADEHDTKLYPAFVYALATASDFLDGFLARRYKASSSLGMVLDPLGDKLMVFSVMVCITIDKIIPLWAVLIVGIKEVLMAIGGFVIHKVIRIDIPPSNLLGKTSTVVFFLVCVALMVFRELPNAAAIALISFAIGLTLLALAGYLIRYVRLMKNREKKVSAPAE